MARGGGLLVPASNLLVWHHLQDETANHKMVRFANGMAIAIAGFYALLFLPLLPLALVAIIVVLGFRRWRRSRRSYAP